MESEFFQIRIPPTANVLDPNDLLPVFQQMLLNSRFDQEAEEAFWFPVTIEHFDDELRDFYEELNHALPLDDYEGLIQRCLRYREQTVSSKFWSRKKKRKTFHAVDTLEVHLAVPTQGVNLLGISPRSIDENFMPVMSHLGAPVAVIDIVDRKNKLTGDGKSGVPGLFRLQTGGEAEEQRHFRRSTSLILRASHNDRRASWEFAEQWLQAGADTSVQFLCTAHKSMPPSSRYVICKAIASENKRTITNTSARKVALPVKGFRG